MQSVSYRDRSFSRERTLLAYTQELRTRVNGISDYSPNSLTVGVIALGQKSFSDCICLWSHWTQEDMLFPALGSVCPEITTSRLLSSNYIKVLIGNNNKEIWNETIPTKLSNSRRLKISRLMPKWSLEIHPSGLPTKPDSRIPKGIQTSVSKWESEEYLNKIEWGNQI